MRRKLLAIALCFLTAAPLAQAEGEGFFTIRKFNGGLNSQASPYVLNEDEGSVYTNIRPNKTYGGIGKRSFNLEYGSPGSFEITGLHRYYQADGDKFLIATGSTKIYLGSDSAGTFTDIGTGYTDGRHWEWVTYKDMAIGMNGVERPVKWDGSTLGTANTDDHRTAGYFVAELGAPFARLNTGTNLDASKWYIYKIAYYDGTDYYYSNAKSNPIQTGAAVYNITLTDIPLGPPGTTKRIIYRTLDNANVAAALANSTYYKVAEISDNTTTTYDDAIADATIVADAAPTWATVSAGQNVTPPYGKIPHIHKEKLFIAGDPDAKSNVYWSENFLPDFFPADYYQPVRPDDGDEITFLKDALGILTIGKTNTIQKLYTDGDPTTWSLSSPFSFIGCPAPWSAVSSPLGIIYLARNGIYRFTGQYSDLISDAVTREMTDLLQSNIDKAAGFYFKNEYHLAYTSQSVGGTANNRVLVYDQTRDAYSLDTKKISVFEAFDAGDDFGTLYHGSSIANGKIMADEGGTKFIGVRLKSEFAEGTFDDARTTGTEIAPELEISWDLTIDELVGTIDTHGYGASAIIDRPDTNGTWTSPIYEINASQLDQIQWHERLNTAGDVTFQVRTASTSGGIAAASWSTAMTNPNGSDLTGLTANNFIQVRANLSTSDITITPNIYVDENYAWKLFYRESGDLKEADFLSEWQSGWLNFGAQGHKKLITRIKVYYQGEVGSLHFQYENDENDALRDFDIDMTVNPSSDTEDAYEGDGTFKVFTHRPYENQEDDAAPSGELWRFNVSETGADEWQVYAIEVMYQTEKVYD